MAFTSVFAPFAQITPDEFRRVTEVSYLGYVNGTMVALSRMRPRNAGTIVQVGSALSERAIPLQSTYCGAKHAINGFTESLRTELMHEHSGVNVTVVQMPAVNTGAGAWVVTLARAGYGAALLSAPQVLIKLTGDLRPGSRQGSEPGLAGGLAEWRECSGRGIWRRLG